MKRILISIVLFCGMIFWNFSVIAMELPEKKSPAQEIVEKFIIHMLNQDFENAAKLSINVSNPEIFKDNVLILEDGYNKEIAYFQKFYKQVLFHSRWLEPQTLYFRKPLESDKEVHIPVEYTERHVVVIPSGETWQYFWRVGYLFILNDKNEIIDVSVIKKIDKLLMVLKPENCIRPAVCD